MSWITIAVIVFVAFVVLSALAAAAHDRFVEAIPKTTAQAFSIHDGDTDLDEYAQGLCRDKEASSGLALVTSNLDAFAARIHTARSSGRSLDLMYYMWNADVTGMLIMREVISAADRGVRVRLLMDDLGVSISDRIFRAIDRHPHIELRLFNPTKARGNIVWRGIEMALRFRSVNRRMHNKAWIADGRVAIVGGRNIGDEYYDAGEKANFRDFDVVMVGDAVGKTEAVFDEYWNSSVAVPVKALLPQRAKKLERLRELMARTQQRHKAEPYLDRVRQETSVESLIHPDGFIWVENVEVLADPPEKATGKRKDGRNLLMDILLPIMGGTTTALNIISPYFIPGEKGVAALTNLAAAGVGVAVLTNSLAATDVAAVHAGYSRYRSPLLNGGVRLYELRSFAAQGRFSLRGSGQASLHTKAFTRDGSYGFIGSLNFDPRSVSLNTEMGVLFKSAALVGLMNEVFSNEISPDQSYSVKRAADGTLVWIGEIDGAIKNLKSEPDATASRQLIVWLIGWLPLGSQL